MAEPGIGGRSILNEHRIGPDGRARESSIECSTPVALWKGLGASGVHRVLALCMVVATGLAATTEIARAAVLIVTKQADTNDGACEASDERGQALFALWTLLR